MKRQICASGSGRSLPIALFCSKFYRSKMTMSNVSETRPPWFPASPVLCKCNDTRFRRQSCIRHSTQIITLSSFRHTISRYNCPHENALGDLETRGFTDCNIRLFWEIFPRMGWATSWVIACVFVQNVFKYSDFSSLCKVKKRPGTRAAR